MFDAEMISGCRHLETIPGQTSLQFHSFFQVFGHRIIWVHAPVAACTIAATFLDSSMTHRGQLNAFIALCSLLLSTVLFGQQQPAKATVQGVVRIARTGEPLAEARVTLISTAPGQPL